MQKAALFPSSSVAEDSRDDDDDDVLDVQIPDLPLDIVIDILSRLPVKTLMRFKCVSKNWNQIICDSPYLVSLHLMRSKQAPNRIICCYQAVDSQANQLGTTTTVLLSSPDEPPFLVECNHHVTVLCSSGDLGLFLVSNDPPPEHQCDYALWNPATRQIKHVPVPPPDEFPARDHMELQLSDKCGVGLDLVANVVKIVVIRKYAYVDTDTDVGFVASKLTSSAVYVYTLNIGGGGGGGGGGWTKLAGDYPYAEPESETVGATNFNYSTHFKGSIYWLCWGGLVLPYIVTFDLGTQVFRKVNCPIDPVLGNRGFRLYICRDSIALFVTKSSNWMSLDVWTLTTQEEELCWIKDSSSSIIAPLPRPLLVEGCWDDHLLLVVPVKEDQDNVLVRDTDDFMVYDTIKQEIKVIKVPNVAETRFFIYKETLANHLT
ncbi:F-box protein At4g19940 [Linum grandiflorum]